MGRTAPVRIALQARLQQGAFGLGARASMERNQERQADAKDGEWNEEMAVSENGLYAR